MLITIKTFYQRGNPPYPSAFRIVDSDQVRLIEPLGDLFVVHLGDVRNDNLRVDAETAAKLIALHNKKFRWSDNPGTAELENMLAKGGR